MLIRYVTSHVSACSHAVAGQMMCCDRTNTAIHPTMYYLLAVHRSDRRVVLARGRVYNRITCTVFWTDGKNLIGEYQAMRTFYLENQSPVVTNYE